MPVSPEPSASRIMLRSGVTPVPVPTKSDGARSPFGAREEALRPDHRELGPDAAPRAGTSSQGRRRRVVTAISKRPVPSGADAIEYER